MLAPAGEFRARLARNDGPARGTPDARVGIVRTSALLPALALALAGCTAAHADDPRERFEKDMMVRFHMHENLGLLRAVEKLLIRGRLEEATALARAIAVAPDEPGLGVYAPHAAHVRELAAALGRATSVDEACLRVARVGVACAGCHAEAGVAPSMSDPPALPRDEPTLESRMARHVWATDRLWEAVIGGETGPWRQGLDVLAAAPFPFSAKEDGRRAIGRKLQRLASAARTIDKLDERGRAYGELLGVCASCHTAAVATKLPSER